jgi:hypothetical protein
MRRRSCKHCGDDTGTIDFDTCGRCCSFKAGQWVQTPDGLGELVSVRHSGGLVVEVAGIGTRLLRGSELTIIDKPAPPPIPQPAQQDSRESGTPTVTSVNTPALTSGTPTVISGTPLLPKTNVPTEAEETSRALDRLEAETETRLDRIHRAWRLEILLRPFPAGLAHPQSLK